MAESVDALVSNTSGATRAGSTPALGTRFLKQGSLRTPHFCMQPTFGIVKVSCLWLPKVALHIYVTIGLEDDAFCL